ncbi:MAG: type V CRISPR-associated protein Cas4 [Ignavibacteria bacterium]|nr:type V CRISPR-associated protein Cas4 [Ignavibacteria bacterium]
MESYIPISFLNDFIFCPRSIYFHQLYGNYREEVYHDKPQTAGRAAHAAVDEKTYSTSKHILIGTEVYSEKYKLHGKIDIFDISKGLIWERKREIKVIYDGYVFQVYAHYHALTEMGYEVKSIIIHDLTHNKNYPIPLPAEDEVMQKKFEKLIVAINSFDLERTEFTPNKNKCMRCIYSNLCDKSLC